MLVRVLEHIDSLNKCHSLGRLCISSTYLSLCEDRVMNLTNFYITVKPFNCCAFMSHYCVYSPLLELMKMIPSKPVVLCHTSKIALKGTAFSVCRRSSRILT